MKKKTIGYVAGLLSALALMCASLMLASCDYWNEDWYKNGDTGTSSGYNMGGSDSSDGASGSDSSDSSGTSSDATVTGASGSDSSDSSGTSSDAGNYTVTITGASGTDLLYGPSGTISCLGAVTGDVITAVAKDASGNAVTSGVTYQWERNADYDDALCGGSSPWVSISGETGASYTVTQDASQRYDYRCKVTVGGTAVYPENSQIVRVQLASPAP